MTCDARPPARRGRFEYGFCVALCTAALCCFAPPAALSQATFVRIAKTGDPVPGVPGAVFDGGIGPLIDARGFVALRARMDGPGIRGTNDDAIFFGRPGKLQIVARERDPLPQFGGDVYLQFIRPPFLAQTGETGFAVEIEGTGIGVGFDDVLLAGPPEKLQVVAREGDTPPDVTDGSVYNGVFSSWALGRGGHIVYRSGLGEPGYIGSPEQSGLWAGTPDHPRLVARTGTQAPGTPAGVHFSLSFLTPGFTINRRGAVAFPAPIDGPGVDATNNAGIWAGTYSDLGLVMRAGDPAPVPGGGARFIGEAQYALVNGNDRVLFPAYVAGDAITGANNYGLWAGRAGAPVELVARNGDPVPLLGAEYTITYIFPYVQTEDDRVVMVTTFTGPGVTPDNNQAIFFGRSGSWELLFREGDPAPGLPDGVVLRFTDGPLHIAIVESGAAGMRLGLGGNGVDDGNNEALFWRAGGAAPWALVAREGELFDGSIIREGGLSLFPTGGGEGARPNINDRGDVVFWVGFEAEPPTYESGLSGAYLVRASPRIVPVASDVRIR